MAARAKIVIGMPNKGDVKFGTMMSLFVTLPIATYDTVLIGQEGPAIAHNRNVICQLALQHQASHVLFVDTDMKFLSNTINQLLALNKPVVGVASRKKKFPKQYTIEVIEDGKLRYIADEELPAELFCRIDGKPITVGTGIMLIDLVAVKEISKPWFKFTEEWEGDEVSYEGEDQYFCKKVWDSSLEVWCDPTIYVKHIGDSEY